MIKWVGFFEKECVEHVELRNLPLALYTNTIICSFVVYIVLADVLLNEGYITIWGPVSVDSEFSDVVPTVTFNLVIKDIKMINDHLMFAIIIVILSSPGLISARHME